MNFIHELNLKITHRTDTEKPFFMVTPTQGYGENLIEFYPIFVGSFEEVAGFVSQCCNVSEQIDIADPDTRVKMSRAIYDLRGTKS